MSAIPASRPIAVRSQTKRRAKSRSKVFTNIVGGVTLFGAVALTTFLVSSMAGQVMVEKARREGISAQRRAIDAKRVEGGLRVRINELTGFTAMDNWALSHGFVAPDRPAVPSEEVTRVAQR